jgi:uncharacterized damage-inducible protein DinB
MNPYAKILGDRNAKEVIASTSSQLEKLFATLGPERAENPPAPGKWNAREILCHLADCEVVFAFRLRQALAEDHHVIQPFDQDRWARTYAAYDVRSALAAFSALRAWNTAFVGALKSEDFSKPVTHPERGQHTIGVIVETMAGHDLNHLRQIEAIAGRSQAA